jgi:hypothetical protein
MSHNSEVDMYNCRLARALPLVHMGIGPDYKGQEQCHYGQRNLDRFSHAPRLYQNNRRCAKDAGRRPTSCVLIRGLVKTFLIEQGELDKQGRPKHKA